MAIFGALAPILIPAAIGAFTSAAMGRNPLQGAVMGGITGGLLGPAGGNLFNLGSSTAATAGTSAATSAGTAFGASQAPTALANSSLFAPQAITSTQQGIQSGITGLADDVAAGTVPTVGVQYPTETFVNEGINQATIDSAFPSMTATAGGIQNQSLLNESMLTQPDAMRMDKLFYKTPDTLFDKVKLLGKQGMDYVSENPYQVLQGGLVAGKLMSPQNPMIATQPSGGSIKQGQQPNLGKPLAVTVPQQRRKIRIG